MTDPIRTALEAICAAHHRDPDGGMGYYPTDPAEGRYGHMEDVCVVCGTADEYGVVWPCWTWQTANAALATPPARSEPERCAVCGRPLLSNAHEWDHEYVKAGDGSPQSEADGATGGLTGHPSDRPSPPTPPESAEALRDDARCAFQIDDIRPGRKRPCNTMRKHHHEYMSHGFIDAARATPPLTDPSVLADAMDRHHAKDHAPAGRLGICGPWCAPAILAALEAQR